MTEQRLAVRRRFARTIAASAALALVGTATGCSSDSPAPEPMANEPSASGTPSAAPSSPGGPPTLPPEARGTSDKAAIAFVEHWVAVFNYATAELVSRPLGDLSLPSCTACTSIIDSIEDIGRRGGDVRGDGWVANDLTLIPNGVSGRPQVRALIRFSPRTVLESEGAKPLRFDGGASIYTFDLAWTEPKGWQVAGVLGTRQ